MTSLSPGTRPTKIANLDESNKHDNNPVMIKDLRFEWFRMRIQKQDRDNFFCSGIGVHP